MLLLVSRIKRSEWTRRAGVTRSQMSQYLTGNICPELPTLLRLLQALGCDLHDFQVLWELDEMLSRSNRQPTPWPRPSLEEDLLLDLVLKARGLTYPRFAELANLPQARIRDLLDNGADLSEERDRILAILENLTGSSRGPPYHARTTEAVPRGRSGRAPRESGRTATRGRRQLVPRTAADRERATRFGLDLRSSGPATSRRPARLGRRRAGAVESKDLEQS